MSRCGPAKAKPGQDSSGSMENPPEKENGRESQRKVATRIVKKSVVPDCVDECEIYVTRKRPLVVYFKRAMELLTVSEHHNAVYKERLGCRRNKKLLRGGGKGRHITIHGMGACIMTAIWLVQDLKYALGSDIQLDVSTKTVEAVDECISEENEWESHQRTRKISGISIKVARKD